MANSISSCILLLFCFLLRGQTLQQSAWMETFTVDVAIQGYNMTTAGETPFECGRSCVRRVSCLAFGFTQDSKTCWLYGHLVHYYNLSGIAAPGTRYFWHLFPSCPSELGYTMKSGLCYRVELNIMTWDQGKELCSQEGAHLFIGNTREKIAVVLQARHSVWLGASDLDKEGDWRWVNGQSLPRRSSFWDRREPNNADGVEHSLELRASGFFNDGRAFARTYRVACQIPVF